jgi:hypothetical protein
VTRATMPSRQRQRRRAHRQQWHHHNKGDSRTEDVCCRGRAFWRRTTMGKERDQVVNKDSIMIIYSNLI